MSDGPDRTEAGLPRLGGPQHVEIDLHVVHLLHASDVGVPPCLIRVDERARATQARARVDDLVAVNAAAAALHLVLRTKRQCRRNDLLWCHVDIVRTSSDSRKT